jgi:translation initiation factor 1A
MAKKKKPEKKGKKKIPFSEESEIIPSRIKMPDRRNGEMFGRVIDILGNDRMEIFAEDGKHYVGRIRGKIKKRVWIRKGDLVVINPWGFETVAKDKRGHCEITWRYMKNEISWLSRNRKIPGMLDINNVPV